MRAFLASGVLSLAISACASGSCPSSLAAVTSMRLTGGAPAADVVVLHSAEELTRLASPLAAPPATASADAAAFEPVRPIASELARLDELVKATDFAAFDVAVVRAGSERGRIIGARNAESGQVTIYFVSSCPPCGGGDPGSYMRAQEEYKAEQSPSAALVRVPKRAIVTTKVCGEGCGPCPSNIP